MCGSDAVPQKRREHQREEVELVGQRLALDALEVGVVAGPQHVGPGVGLGEYVTVLLSAASSTTGLFCPQARPRCPAACDRNSTGPSGPVSVTPPGSLLTCPTGRRSACPSPVPCGLPLTSFWPSAVMVIVCGALASGLGVRLEAALEDHHRQHRPEDHQQRPLDELHVGRRDHARGDDDQDHDRPDDQHAGPVREPEQRLDQRAGADHLRDQVEDAHDQRADRRRRA